MKPRHFLFCSALLLAATPVASETRGQPEAEASEAEQERAYKLYGQGLKLYDRGRFKLALRKFLEVDGIMASPNARLYIARCYRKLNRLPKAFEAMSAAVEIATKKAQSDSTYLRTRDAAAAEREQVAAEIGRIVIAAAEPPEGLEIELNSRVVKPGQLGKQLGVNPGTVLVTATAPEHENFSREVEVEAGALETIAVTMRPLGGDATGGEGEPSTALRTAGFVSLGVGVVGMGMFAIAGLMANDRFAQIEDECGQPPCTDPKYTDLIEEGQTMDLLANIGLGVGIAGIVAGTAMVIFGWPYGESEQGDDETIDEESDEEEDIEQSVSFDVGPDRAGVLYRLRF